MIYNNDITIVENCNELTYQEIEEVEKEIIKYRKENNLQITRSNYSNEIKTHKLLYKLGLFKKRTKDADLEENINPILKIIYNIIGFFL